MEEKRTFKGIWIPAEIWLDETLTLQEKVFLVEIDSLDNGEGCFASNAYFAKFFNLSTKRCSEIINTLESKGHVKISYKYKDGTKYIEKRIIKINKTPLLEVKEDKEDISGKLPYPEKSELTYPENFQDNNIIYNNIYIYWLEKDIVKHKKLTANMEKAIKKALKDYTEKEICQAIDNYNTVLKDENYFYSHIFTLEAFLKQSNGLPQFTDEGIHWINYCSKSKTKEKNKPEPRHDAPQGTKFANMSVEDTFKFLSDLK